MSPLTPRQTAYLQAMGVTVWRAQSAPVSATQPVMVEQPQVAPTPEVASGDWEGRAVTVV